MNTTGFQISGLSIATFRHYFQMSDAELAEHKARRVVADSKPGFPCRVSLIDAEPGESVILLAYPHHDVNGPYYGIGPIYIRENANPAALGMNELPEVVKTRLISARAYTLDGLLQASGVAEGIVELKNLIEQLFEDKNVSYLHLHNAKPGCYSCRVDRILD